MRIFIIEKNKLGDLEQAIKQYSKFSEVSFKISNHGPKRLKIKITNSMATKQQSVDEFIKYLQENYNFQYL